MAQLKKEQEERLKQKLADEADKFTGDAEEMRKKLEE